MVLKFENFLNENQRDDLLNEIIKTIFYHGTNSEFDKFDIRYFNAGSGDGGWLGKGFYFTNDYNYAISYSEYDKGYLLHVKLYLSKPYILTDFQYSTRPNKLKNKLAVNNSREVTEKLKSFGYDSVVLTYIDENTNERQYEICVFDPNDIKIVKVVTV